MTAKWHNGKNGPGVCRASKKSCPYGGSEAHFDSKEEAQKAFDEQNEAAYGFMPSVEVPEVHREVSMFDGRGRVLSSSALFDSTPNSSSEDKINKILGFNAHNGVQFAERANETSGSRGVWEVASIKGDKVTFKVTPHHPDEEVAYVSLSGKNFGDNTKQALIKKINEEKLFPKEYPFEKDNKNMWLKSGDHDFVSEEGSLTNVRQSIKDEDTYEFLSYRYDPDNQEYLVYRGEVKINEGHLKEVDDFIGLSDDDSFKELYTSKYDPHDVANVVECFEEKLDNKPARFKRVDYQTDWENIRKSLSAHGF